MLGGGGACVRTHCALGDRLGCAPCVPALGEPSGLLEHSMGGAMYCKGRQADASTEGALRRESPQGNPVSSLVKMRQPFKPSKAASNPGEQCTSHPQDLPDPSVPSPRLAHQPSRVWLRVFCPSQPPPPRLLSYRITWGFCFFQLLH